MGGFRQPQEPAAGAVPLLSDNCNVCHAPLGPKRRRIRPPVSEESTPGRDGALKSESACTWAARSDRPPPKVRNCAKRATIFAQIRPGAMIRADYVAARTAACATEPRPTWNQTMPKAGDRPSGRPATGRAGTRCWSPRSPDVISRGLQLKVRPDRPAPCEPRQAPPKSPASRRPARCGRVRAGFSRAMESPPPQADCGRQTAPWSARPLARGRPLNVSCDPGPARP